MLEKIKHVERSKSSWFCNGEVNGKSFPGGREPSAKRSVFLHDVFGSGDDVETYSGWWFQLASTDCFGHESIQCETMVFGGLVVSGRNSVISRFNSSLLTPNISHKSVHCNPPHVLPDIFGQTVGKTIIIQ
jgi:hypothetical protein